jgi:RNA polymerase sigma-70 factor (ECF subfamily)
LIYLKVDDKSQTLEGVPEGGPNQEELFHYQQMETILQHAISHLNLDQREVFLMREKLTLSFAEIAEILGHPQSTVKSRMYYALRNLKEYLLQHYSFEDIVT